MNIPPQQRSAGPRSPGLEDFFRTRSGVARVADGLTFKGVHIRVGESAGKSVTALP